jgi:hypothetical protein
MRFGLTLLVRPSIGETLADDALRGHFGAHIVIVTWVIVVACRLVQPDGHILPGTDPFAGIDCSGLECGHRKRSKAFFADLDPPQNLAPSSDEILGIERQMIPEKVKGVTV